jgi:Piwi domain
VAGVIVQLIEKNTPSPDIKLYTESFVRDGGDEYDLRDALKSTVGNALKAFKVDPASVVCWRDGIGERAIDLHAEQEIIGIREGCTVNSIVGAGKKANNPHLTYIVCQKRIATKFFSRNVTGHEDGKFGVPAGTLVSTLQSLNCQTQTFYINGRAPPYSTPKPVRFICVQRDAGHKNVPIAELTWGQCHNYPNWTGPIKVPSVCQMAHKLGELTGQMADAGASINNAKVSDCVMFGRHLVTANATVYTFG